MSGVSAAAVLARMSGAPAAASSGAAAMSAVDALRTMTDPELRALYDSTFKSKSKSDADVALWKSIYAHIRAEIDASAERYRRFAQNIPNDAGTNAPSAADQARLYAAWVTHTAVIDQINRITPAA